MYHVYINDSWKPWSEGGHYNGWWLTVGTFESQAEAESALVARLDSRYPGQWKRDGSQFVHVQGGGGEQVVGGIYEIDVVAAIVDEICKARAEGDALSLMVYRRQLAQYE